MTVERAERADVGGVARLPVREEAHVVVAACRRRRSRGTDVTPLATIASASGASGVTTSVFVRADCAELLLVVGRREHGVAAADEVEGAVVAELRARVVNV